MYGVYSPKHYLSYAINFITMEHSNIRHCNVWKKKVNLEKKNKQDLREQYSVDYENVFDCTNPAESYQALPT